MGFERHHYRERRFVWTRITGSLCDEDLREQVSALNEECAGVVGLRELGDCREITDLRRTTVNGTTAIAATETVKPGSRFAILTPADSPLIFGMARACQSFALAKRDAVHIFHDLNEALAWLAEDDKDLNALKAFITAIQNKPAAEL